MRKRNTMSVYNFFIDVILLKNRLLLNDDKKYLIDDKFKIFFYNTKKNASFKKKAF